MDAIDIVFLLEVIAMGSNYVHVVQTLNLYLSFSASLTLGNFIIHLHLISFICKTRWKIEMDRAFKVDYASLCQQNP